MSFVMSKVEREAFLRETRVGILSVAQPGRGPLAVPVWYAYSPGGAVRMVISSASRKAELLRAAGRASLCVQADVPPYKYVSVEGAAVLGEPDFERDEREMAHRYLGAQWESDILLQPPPNAPRLQTCSCRCNRSAGLASTTAR